MVISLENICFNYKEKEIFKNLNLEVKEGSITGLLGLNGIGKTTLIKTILGLYEPTHGDITLFGEILNEANRNDLLVDIGILIEQASLYDQMTVYENLNITRLIRGGNKNELYEILDLLKIEEYINYKIKHLSMGVKQKVGLALAMITKPKLLILDEPTNGLDPQSSIDFRNTIISLNQNFKTTFLISSHILSDLEHIATDIKILSNKKIINYADFESQNFEFSLQNVKIENLQFLVEKFPNLVMDNINFSSKNTSQKAEVFELMNAKNIEYKLKGNIINLEEFFLKSTQS